MCGGMGSLARTGGPGHASGAYQGRIQAERFFLIFFLNAGKMHNPRHRETKPWKVVHSNIINS